MAVRVSALPTRSASALLVSLPFLSLASACSRSATSVVKEHNKVDGWDSPPWTAGRRNPAETRPGTDQRERQKSDRKRLGQPIVDKAGTPRPEH